MAWIAVDAGTSMIKAVLFNAAGEEIAVARRTASILTPHPGWAEQDMDEVWQAVAVTVREVAAGSGEPIEGLVTTAQGDGCWLVDAAGRPAGNAILWCDGRAAELIEAWNAAGVLAHAQRISGSVPYAGLGSAILRWLERYESKWLAQGRWMLTANGWMHSRLTGRFAADLSDACNPFGEKTTGAYSHELLALCGLSAYTHLLPPIVTGQHTVAALGEAAAHELGLEPALPVVMAPYDIVATAYGAGAVSHGHSCVILGTTLASEMIIAMAEVPERPLGTLLALHDGQRLLAIPTLTGCGVLDWAVQLFSLDTIEHLEQLAEGAAWKTQRPFFLPYLSPAGERAPFLNTRARGSFHGLTLATTPADMAFSVYEGLSFVVRECLEASGATTAHELVPEVRGCEVRVCGGGARSDLWCQLIADCTGRSVVRAYGSEIGARGAYLYALYVTGKVAGVAEAACELVKPERVFLPETSARLRLDRRFHAFRGLRSHAAEQWTILGGLA